MRTFHKTNLLKCLLTCSKVNASLMPNHGSFRGIITKGLLTAFWEHFLKLMLVTMLALGPKLDGLVILKLTGFPLIGRRGFFKLIVMTYTSPTIFPLGSRYNFILMKPSKAPYRILLIILFRLILFICLLDLRFSNIPPRMSKFGIKWLSRVVVMVVMVGKV